MRNELEYALLAMSRQRGFAAGHESTTVLSAIVAVPVVGIGVGTGVLVGIGVLVGAGVLVGRGPPFPPPHPAMKSGPIALAIRLRGRHFHDWRRLNMRFCWRFRQVTGAFVPRGWRLALLFLRA